MTLLEEIQASREGKVATIPFKHSVLARYIFIARKMYHLIAGSGGTGKCLAKGTNVIMYDGSLKKVEDVQIGDLLMGIDSLPRKVINTVSGTDQLYTINQNNGEPYTVNSAHKVTLNKRHRNGKTEILNIEAQELHDNFDKYRYEHYCFKVPVEFEEKEVTIDPYLIGLWLGDGSNNKPLISNADIEVKEYIIKECEKLGFTPTIYNRNNCDHISLVAKGKQVRNITEDKTFPSCKKATEYYGISHQEYVSRACTENNILNGCEWEHVEGNKIISDGLRNLNLYNNKHIPHIYLCNSKENRLKLLAGLIDSDGYKDPKTNCYEITTVYEQLSKDIVYLLRSLGFKTTIKKRKQDVFIKEYEYKDYESYRIHFTGDIEIPCLVQRKKCTYKTKYRKLNTGISISKNEVGEYYGFTLQGKDHYFLLEDFTVTHNSAYIDLNYIINPYLWSKKNPDSDIKLKIILRSMERSKAHRIAKWVCMKLYLNYGILIDTATLLGWGLQKSKITDELYELIVKAYDEIEEMSDIVEVVDGVENPTGLQIHAIKYMQTIGTLFYYKDNILLKKRNGTILKAEPAEAPKNSKGQLLVNPYQPVYVSDNDKKIVIHITDNLQAMKKEQGFSDKQNYDKMSEYARILRDLYHVTPVVVNQLNRGIEDTTRRLKTELLPQRKDFAGSDQPYSDADMAAILFNPYDYKIDNLKGWQINKCVDNSGINRFRSLHLLKNSYGPDNQIFGFQFVGENGLFNEIPHPDKATDRDYYNIANPPNKHKLTNY